MNIEAYMTTPISGLAALIESDLRSLPKAPSRVESDFPTRRDWQKWRMLCALKDGDKTTNQFAVLIRVSNSRASDWARQLVRAGKIENIGNQPTERGHVGLFRITDIGREALK